MGIWRTHKPQTAPVTVALHFCRPLVSSGQPKWQSTNSVEAVHKLMLCEDLALRYRLTTTAADKASVFTEFMAEALEEEEAAGRRRRARGGEMWVSASTDGGKKMTWGNGTIMVPTGIQVSGLKIWSGHSASPGRGFRHSLRSKGECMTPEGTRGRKARWVEEKDKLASYARCLFLQQWDGMCWRIGRKTCLCVRKQKQEGSSREDGQPKVSRRDLQ